MSGLRPWAAWIGGIAGWYLSQQLGSDLVQLDCRHATLLACVIGLVGAAILLLGAALSWPIWRRAEGDLSQPHAGSRRFVAGTGELAAAIFLLAIILQTASSFILPQCHA